MKLLIVFLACSLFVLLGLWRVDAMSSTNYSITWDNISVGGDEQSTSTNYLIYDTIGQPSAATATSTSYLEIAGYRPGTTPLALSLAIRGQSSQNPVAYSAFSSAARTVTVTDSGGFSLDGYIVVVENRGFSELVAFGKVIAIDGQVLTVDTWGGQPGVVSATPLGGNDFVYQLGSLAGISFGTTTVGAEHIGRIGLSALSTATNGHSIYLQGNQLLQTVNANIFTSVLDGTVSSNAAEYGVETVGTYSTSGQDEAVTTTPRLIVSSNIPAEAVPDRAVLLFKIGVTSSTNPGTYQQTIFLTMTSNF